MPKLPPGGRSLLSLLLAIVLPVAGLAGVIAGLIALDHRLVSIDTRRTSGVPTQPSTPRIVPIKFAVVDFEPPPGISIDGFLAEVRYLAEKDRDPVPDALGPDAAQKVRTAFLRHPWVERVDEVTPLPNGNLHIGLTYRTPVLAVANGARRRAVDRHGIRLPDDAPTDGLPVLNSTSQPHGRAGTVWGDEQVEDAARLAGFLHDWQAKLQLTEIEFRTSDMVLLRKSGTPFVWGKAPGKEGSGEHSAERKRKQLLAGGMP